MHFFKSLQYSREKSQLRLEVAARRQKRLLSLHARQKYLEEAASHEMELLQEFDRFHDSLSSRNSVGV